MASQQQLLQELFILATGRPANTPNRIALESIVGPAGDLHALDDVINSHMNAQHAALGTSGIVQAVARHALGRTITAEQANNAANDLIAAGLDTWAKIFHWLANDTSEMTTTLNNRAEATVYFTNALEADGKTDLFNGQVIWSAATTLIQTVDSSTQSVTTAKSGLSTLAHALTADGIQSTVVDGYVREATVFIDANGNGKQDDGEWSTVTDAGGNYTLPENAPVGTIIAYGGIDLMTNLPFQGVLTAPAGFPLVNPLTTLVQALVASGEDVADAQTAVITALGLPANVSPLTYDPLGVFADPNASDADKAKALEVQSTALQVANVITQAANAISAASGANTTLAGASNAVTNALASAIKNAADGGTAIDLKNGNTLTTIVTEAATSTGSGTASSLTPTEISQLVTITAYSNAYADSARNITDLTKVAVVTQGDATAAIVTGATNGSLASAATAFSGDAMNSAVNNATPGLVAPGVVLPAPTPIPAPAPPPSVTPPPAASGDSDTSTPVFSVTESTEGTWTLGTSNGNVVVTIDDTDFVFTPASGTAVKVPVDNVDTLVVSDSITLSGEIDVLMEISAITGKVTLTGATATDRHALASELVAIDARTGIDIDASAISAITGSAAHIKGVYAGGFTGLGDELVTVSGSTTAADVNTILNATTGRVSLTLDIGYTSGGSFVVSAGDSIDLNPTGSSDGFRPGPQGVADYVEGTGDWHFNAGNGLFTWADLETSGRKSMTLTGITAIEVYGTGIRVPAAQFTVFGTTTLALSGGSGDITMTYDADSETFTFTNGVINQVVPGTDIDAITLPVGRTLKGDAEHLDRVGSISGNLTITGPTPLDAAVAIRLRDKTDGNITATSTAVTGNAEDVRYVGDDMQLPDDYDVMLQGNAQATDLTNIRDDTTGNIDGSGLTSISGDTDYIMAALRDIDMELPGRNAWTAIISGAGRLTEIGDILSTFTNDVDLSGMNMLHVDTDGDISSFDLDSTGLVFRGNHTVTTTLAQHNNFTQISTWGGGSNGHLVVSGTGTFSTSGGAKEYTVQAGSIVTLGTTASHRAQAVNEAGSGVTTFILGAGNYTGAWSGVDADDVLTVVNGTNLSGASGLDAVTIDLQGGAGVTLTLNAAQAAGATFTNAGTSTINVVDTSANIASNLTGLVANAAHLDSIDSSQDATAITLNAAQITALGSKLSAGDTVNVSDNSANLTANISALVDNVANVDAIDSTDDGVAVNLTAAQFSSLVTKLNTTDTFDIDADAASGGDLSALSTDITKVDAISNLTLTSNQTTTVMGNLFSKTSNGTVQITAGGMSPAQFDVVAANAAKVDDTPGISGIMALTSEQNSSELEALFGLDDTTADAIVDATGMGFEAIDVLALYSGNIANDGITGTITAAGELSVDDFGILGSAVSADAVVTVTDTGANIKALASDPLDVKIDFVDAKDDVLSLTFAEFENITYDKLVSGDVVTILDAGATIAGISAIDFANQTNVDTYDASDDQLTLNVAQALAAGAKLTADDVLTIVDLAVNVAGKTLVLDTGDKLSITGSTLEAASDSDDTDFVIGKYEGGVSTTVDLAGEWQFNTATEVLTFFDGTAAQQVTLTGVASVTADGIMLTML